MKLGLAFEYRLHCKRGDFMPKQELEGKFVFASSAFALGVLTGLFLKDAVSQMYERARNRVWRRDYERTDTYGENLPESLARREPAPDPGQPRFGGTGAIGVSSAAVVAARPDEINSRR
jgi:hypothetical protein